MQTCTHINMHNRLLSTEWLNPSISIFNTKCLSSKLLSDILNAQISHTGVLHYRNMMKLEFASHTSKPNLNYTPGLTKHYSCSMQIKDPYKIKGS